MDRKKEDRSPKGITAAFQQSEEIIGINPRFYELDPTDKLDWLKSMYAFLNILLKHATDEIEKQEVPEEIAKGSLVVTPSALSTPVTGREISSV